MCVCVCVHALMHVCVWFCVCVCVCVCVCTCVFCITEITLFVFVVAFVFSTPCFFGKNDFNGWDCIKEDGNFLFVGQDSDIQNEVKALLEKYGR